MACVLQGRGSMRTTTLFFATCLVVGCSDDAKRLVLPDSGVIDASGVSPQADATPADTRAPVDQHVDTSDVTDAGSPAGDPETQTSASCGWSGYFLAPFAPASLVLDPSPFPELPEERTELVAATDGGVPGRVHTYRVDQVPAAARDKQWEFGLADPETGSSAALKITWPLASSPRFAVGDVITIQRRLARRALKIDREWTVRKEGRLRLFIVEGSYIQTQARRDLPPELDIADGPVTCTFADECLPGSAVSVQVKSGGESRTIAPGGFERVGGFDVASLVANRGDIAHLKSTCNDYPFSEDFLVAVAAP